MPGAAHGIVNQETLDQRPAIVSARRADCKQPFNPANEQRRLARNMRVALPNEPEHAMTPDPRPADERDSLSHLIAVVRGGRAPNALSSLENNLIVTEILDAARESARTQARVALDATKR